MRTRTSEDVILDIPEGSVGRGRGQVPCGGAPPPPPVSLEQLLATQNDLMRRLIENDEHRGAERQQPRHQERDSLYLEFLATHLLVFAEASASPVSTEMGHQPKWLGQPETGRPVSARLHSATCHFSIRLKID
jgi:hypothetical protein